MDQKKLAMEQQQMLTNFESVKQDLLQLPNVVAVGLGIKETGGQFTEEISYRVYVAEKQDPALLGASEAIPKTIGNFKTDVLTPLVLEDDSDVCGNERRTKSKERPLQAGIAISPDKTSYGTLGWFGTLNIDGTPVLLTNKHILYKKNKKKDGVFTSAIKVAQPTLKERSKCCCCECGSDNVIGESLIGIRNTSPLTSTSVEVAIARIDAEHASNIVLSITNDSTEEVLSVKGTAAAVVGQDVRKVGARSGFTRGTVIHIGAIAVAPTDPGGGTISVRSGQVLVIPAANETYEVREKGVCKRAFTNSGDSGAVIINDDDMIIALNWNGNRKKYTIGLTVACDINNVITALANEGFPITLSITPGGGDRDFVRTDPVAALRVSRQAQQTRAAGKNVFERLRDANRESLLAWIFERHHQEVLHLVNHIRAVTVAWHRHQGPAFVAALSRASRVEHYRVPFEINGINRHSLLKAMEDVLLVHGSPSLRKEIERYRDDLMSFADQWQTVEEMAQGLKALGLLDVVPVADNRVHTGT